MWLVIGFVEVISLFFCSSYDLSEERRISISDIKEMTVTEINGLFVMIGVAIASITHLFVPSVPPVIIAQPFQSG